MCVKPFCAVGGWRGVRCGVACSVIFFVCKNIYKLLFLEAYP